MLLVGDEEGGMECWNLDRMDRLWSTNGYHWSVRGLAVTSLRDAPVVISCSRDGIYVLDLHKGTPLNIFSMQTIAPPGVEDAISVIPFNDSEGPKFATGHEDGIVRIWGLESGAMLLEKKVASRAIWQLLSSEVNGHATLLAATVGQHLCYMRSSTLDVIALVAGDSDKNTIPAVAVGLSSGEPLVHCVHQRQVSTYALPTLERVSSVPLETGDIISITKVEHPSHPKIVAGGLDQHLYVMEADDLLVGASDGTAQVTAVASVGRQGAYLACGHSDGSICLRDSASGQKIECESWQAPGAIRSIVSLGHEGGLVLGCKFDGGVRIWQGELVATLLDAERSDSISCFCLAIGQSGLVMAIGTDSGTVETYDLLPALSLRGKVEMAHSRPSPNQADPSILASTISGLAIFPGETTLLASSGWEDMAVKLWRWDDLRAAGMIATDDYIVQLEATDIAGIQVLVSAHLNFTCRILDPFICTTLREYRSEPAGAMRNGAEGRWLVGMALGRIVQKEVIVLAERERKICLLDASNMVEIASFSVGYGIWGQAVAVMQSCRIAVRGGRGVTAAQVQPDYFAGENQQVSEGGA